MTVPFSNRVQSRLPGCLILLGLSALPLQASEPVPTAAPPAAAVITDDFPQAAAEALFHDSPGVGDDLQAMKAARFRELKSKLDELSRLLPHKQSSGAAEPAAVPDPATDSAATDPAATTGSAGTTPKGAAESGQTSPEKIQSAPNQDSKPAPSASDPLVSEEQNAQPDLLAGKSSPPRTVKFPTGMLDEMKPVPDPLAQAQAEPLEGPIDRFGLACSLFGTGDTEACLKVLLQTDHTVLTQENRAWSEYMQACCHRKAGRGDEAREIYRRLVTRGDPDWIATLARWWLDNIDAKNKLKADREQLNQTLSAWEKELESLTAK